MTRKDNDDTKVSLAEIRKDIEYLSHNLDEGFKGVYKRQDTTNGKVLKNCDDIRDIKERINNKLDKTTYAEAIATKKNKIIEGTEAWKLYIVKTIVAAMISLLLFLLGVYYGP